MGTKKWQVVFIVVLMLLFPLGALAGGVTDSFDTTHNYTEGDVSGTIWDGLFFGQDEGNLGTVNSIVTNADNAAHPGALYMESEQTHFNHQGMDSPFLYITVDGDFVASVQIVDLATQGYNEAGICARIANDTSDGSNEDYVWARKRGWSGPSTQFRNLDNGTKTDHATSDNVDWVRLARVGNDFIMSISADGQEWTETFTMTRDDMDGMPLQVGLVQASYSTNINWAYFDNFTLEGDGVGSPVAVAPSPSNEATNVLRQAVLSWRPGPHAVSHNVYFGTDADAVQAADSSSPLLVASGTDITYNPGGMQFGETYYWRVDEVNDADPNSPWIGNIWSFKVETYASELSVDTIQVSATNSAANQDPNNLINGSGLNEKGQHSSSSGDMWTAVGSGDTSLVFTLDQVYKLHQIRVWNANSPLESFYKMGVKDLSIETSLDGDTWVALKSVELPQAPGNDQYEGDLVDLDGVTAQYVRLILVSNHAGISAAPTGLSEVSLMYVPVWPSKLAPVDGSDNMSPDPVLSWRAGREADLHKVYLGTDPANLEFVDTVDVTSYDTAPLDLNLGQTYYWRIDEVNDTEVPTTWMGDVLSFTVGETLSIDDMERYQDKAGFFIFDYWADGWNDTTNGSIVGNGDNPELAYVHEGAKSMPLTFDNDFAGKSEATLSLGGMDFDRAGVQGLEIFFSGYTTGVASSQLYVVIDGKKLVYSGVAIASDGVWRRWYIPLTDLAGVNLDAVDSLTVGVEGSGSGTLYVDSIRLTPQPAPVMGDADLLNIPDLVVGYRFNGNTDDTLGAYPVTLIADPNMPTIVDDALQLDGGYAVVKGFKGVLAREEMQNPFTLACWFQTTMDACLLGWGSPSGVPVGGQYTLLRIHGGTLRIQHGNGNLRGNTAVTDGEWHHAAVTVIQNAVLQTPDTTIYVDGQADTTFSGSINIWNVYSQNDMLIGDSSWTGDAALRGSIDEVRVYKRDLTADEVGQLAGK